MHQFRLPSWREYYNPLRGLTLARLRAMPAFARRLRRVFERMRRNSSASGRSPKGEGGWFWHAPRLRQGASPGKMAQTDVTVQGAIARRLAFVETLGWEIQTVEGADPALAAEQKDLLTFAYNRIENFADATRFLAGANWAGYRVDRAQLEEKTGLRLIDIAPPAQGVAP